nr:MAG TPA: hypothetical protein [Caudoviricetes sp.]
MAISTIALNDKLKQFKYMRDRNLYIIDSYPQTDSNIGKYLTSMDNLSTTIDVAVKKGDRAGGVIDYIDNTAIPYLRAVYEKIRHTQNRV